MELEKYFLPIILVIYISGVIIYSKYKYKNI
jgi:hypothetical protein